MSLTTVTSIQPQRAGLPWGIDEENDLISKFKLGYSFTELGRMCQRTPGAVIARLELRRLLPGATYIPSDRTPYEGTKPVETTKQGTKIVNMNHLITLLQKGYTTVNVYFKAGEQTYRYKVSEETAAKLKKDDAVVVPGSSKTLSIGFVHSVDESPQIDVKAPYEYKWIVCRVDREAYDDQVVREKEAVQKLEQAERLRAQQEAIAALLDGMGNKEEFLALINGGAK